MRWVSAMYTAGIVKNHPSVDGYKRTGFVVGVFSLGVQRLFLRRNGRCGSAGDACAGSGSIDEGGCGEVLRANAKRSPARQWSRMLREKSVPAGNACASWANSTAAFPAAPRRFARNVRMAINRVGRGWDPSLPPSSDLKPPHAVLKTPNSP